MPSAVVPLATPGARILAVTSALPGEGKTTAALCLGRVAARSGARVLLIDGDPRRRGVTRMLGLDPQAGLAEVLHGAATWRNVAVLDPASGLQVLPLAASGLSADDAFATPAMDALLVELRQAFDLILIDTAPPCWFWPTPVLWPPRPTLFCCWRAPVGRLPDPGRRPRSGQAGPRLWPLSPRRLSQILRRLRARR